MFGHDGDQDDDDTSMPDLDPAAPPHLNPHQNPFANDDPDETDISNFNMVQLGPGRFNVQATITRSGSVAGFMSMLNGLTRAATQPNGQGEGLFAGPTQSAYQDAQGQGQPGTHTGRFTYHGGARLTPRGDGPGMRVEPVDDISK